LNYINNHKVNFHAKIFLYLNYKIKVILDDLKVHIYKILQLTYQYNENKHVNILLNTKIQNIQFLKSNENKVIIKIIFHIVIQE